MTNPAMTTFSLMSLAAPSSGFNGKYGIFVSNTVPFGWKISAYIYHSTSLLVSHYLRSIGVPCAAKAAVFLAVYTLTCLGYTLGLKKCVFHPQKAQISRFYL